MGERQLCDSHAKARLHDTLGAKKKAGQGSFRLTKTDSATSRAAWAWTTSSPGLSRRRGHVEQRRSVLCCAEHPDPGRTGRQRTAVRRSGDHLGALDVSTGVWGGDQPPGGARGPQPPTRPPPSGCARAASPSPRGSGPSPAPDRPSGAPSRRRSGQSTQHVGMTAGAAGPSPNSASTLSYLYVRVPLEAGFSRSVSTVAPSTASSVHAIGTPAPFSHAGIRSL